MIAIKSEKDFDFIKRELESGNSNKDLSEQLKSKLNTSQKNELARLLNDKAALNKLLNSDKAKSIIKKLTGEKNGQHK